VRDKLNATGVKPSKFDATTAPGVTDDDSDTAGRLDGLNFEIGSVWVDSTLDHAYFCADATTGAAVWHRFGAQKSSGSCYISTPCTSSPQGLPTEIGATTGGTAAIDLVDFTHTSPGRLTYTGASTEKFVITATLSMTHSVNNTLCSFFVAINGVGGLAAGSQIDRKIGTGADAGNVVIRWIASLSTGDFIEIYEFDLGGIITINWGVIDVALRGN